MRMLNSIWQLLANFGVDTQAIAEEMGALMRAVMKSSRVTADSEHIKGLV